MNQFRSNRILLDYEAVAGQLKDARRRKNISVEEAARALSIGQKYLEALEAGDFAKLPEGVYGKNFLRQYAAFLGLDEAELEEIFKKETEDAVELRKKNLFSRQIAKMRYFLAMPRIIRNAAIAVVVAISFVYLAFAAKTIISPPFLSVESPRENLATAAKTIKVAGKAEAESQVTINGRRALLDAEGNFSENVNLKNGINIISVRAKKRYGREAVVERKVLVKRK